MYMRVNIFANMLSQQKADEEQQNNLNGVTEILKFGASLVEGFIALMGQKVIVLIFQSDLTVGAERKPKSIPYIYNRKLKILDFHSYSFRSPSFPSCYQTR